MALKSFNELKEQVVNSANNKENFVCVDFNTDAEILIPKILEEQGFEVYKGWVQTTDFCYNLDRFFCNIDSNKKYALFLPEVNYYRTDCIDVLRTLIATNGYNGKEYGNIFVCASATVKEYSEDVSQIKGDSSAKTDILKCFPRVYKWFNYTEESWKQLSPYIHKEWDAEIGAETINKVIEYAFAYNSYAKFESILKIIKLAKTGDAMYKNVAFLKNKLSNSCRLSKFVHGDPDESNLYSNEQIEKALDELAQIISNA